MCTFKKRIFSHSNKAKYRLSVMFGHDSPPVKLFLCCDPNLAWELTHKRSRLLASLSSLLHDDGFNLKFSKSPYQVLMIVFSMPSFDVVTFDVPTFVSQSTETSNYEYWKFLNI